MDHQFRKRKRNIKKTEHSFVPCRRMTETNRFFPRGAKHDCGAVSWKKGRKKYRPTVTPHNILDIILQGWSRRQMYTIVIQHFMVNAMRATSHRETRVDATIVARFSENSFIRTAIVFGLRSRSIFLHNGSSASENFFFTKTHKELISSRGRFRIAGGRSAEAQ